MSNYIDIIANGFKTIAEGMSHITLFPDRYDFNRIKHKTIEESMKEDYEALKSDWAKICPFQ